MLEFFTSHFLEMAKKSNEYRNKGQSYLYMQTAKNLLRILDVINRWSDCLSMMTILQDKSFGERQEIRDKKTEMAKLEENVNFQMYFKDYWNIRWGKG